jgi:hypothetical protein
VREGAPHQLLFYSNAQDFTASWHFLHLFRRADLPFDLIGVGCHDSGQDLSEIRPAYTVRKAIKVISSYRPYVLSPGSPAGGVAPGEGEGGRAEHPEEVLNYYRGALFDEIGGGVAWTQTYNWCHISGADATTPPHETPLLHWFADFQPAVQGTPFPLKRKVEVLVVRNANLQHSNMSGLDYGNALAVAEALMQLNVEFDIVMDRDLVTGAEPLKIDLRPYRLVIVPTLEVDMAEGAWRALDKWLGEDGGGGRVLALGRVGEIGRRLEPRAGFPPMLSRWLGTDRYARKVELRGNQSLGLVGDGGRSLVVDVGSIPPTGVLGVGTPVLVSAAGDPTAASAPVGHGQVVAFGFPLGFVDNYLWGELTPEQSPRDAVVPLYEWLAREAGVERPVVAPHNLRVYVSAGARMVLVRERAGLATDTDIAFRAPAGVRYGDGEPRRDAEGRAVVHVTLSPWEGRWWTAAGGSQ